MDVFDELGICSIRRLQLVLAGEPARIHLHDILSGRSRSVHFRLRRRRQHL